MVFSCITNADGSPITEEQRELLKEQEKLKKMRNLTEYSHEKNIERIADSLESIAADAERIADMLALFGQKGAQNDR